MADFSLLGGNPPAIENGFDVTGAAGKVVTANSTTHTVGTYTELVTAAGNTLNSEWLSLEIYGANNATDSDFLFNIALGEAGSEIDIVENIFAYGNSLQEGGVFSLPLKIPTGVRISVNCQSNITNATSEVFINRGKGDPGLSKVITYGANTAGTSGVSITQGDGAWGSWVEISASTSENIKGFLIAAHRAGITSWTSSPIAYQLAVGSSGNEEVISPTIEIQVSASELMTRQITEFFPIGIASGERISMRAVATGTNSDFTLNYIVYGVS